MKKEEGQGVHERPMAIVSFIFGIQSIVFGIVNPISGIVFGILGIIFAVREKKNGGRLAKKSFVLNIIGIIVSIIVILLSIASINYLKSNPSIVSQLGGLQGAR